MNAATSIAMSVCIMITLECCPLHCAPPTNAGFLVAVALHRLKTDSVTGSLLKASEKRTIVHSLVSSIRGGDGLAYIIVYVTGSEHTGSARALSILQ